MAKIRGVFKNQGGLRYIGAFLSSVALAWTDSFYVGPATLADCRTEMSDKIFESSKTLNRTVLNTKECEDFDYPLINLSAMITKKLTGHSQKKCKYMWWFSTV